MSPQTIFPSHITLEQPFITCNVEQSEYSTPGIKWDIDPQDVIKKLDSIKNESGTRYSSAEEAKKHLKKFLE